MINAVWNVRIKDMKKNNNQLLNRVEIIDVLLWRKNSWFLWCQSDSLMLFKTWTCNVNKYHWMLQIKTSFKAIESLRLLLNVAVCFLKKVKRETGPVVVCKSGQIFKIDNIDAWLITKIYRCIHKNDWYRNIAFEVKHSWDTELIFLCILTPGLNQSHLLYLILPSWLLALDRGCRAMKSSPIATRLEYIYTGRIHREDGRKNTHRHTEKLNIKHTQPTFRISCTQTKDKPGQRFRAETTNASQDWKSSFFTKKLSFSFERRKVEK